MGQKRWHFITFAVFTFFLQTRPPSSLCLLLPLLCPHILSLSFVQCQALVVGGSLSPDGPLWSFMDDRRTEEGLPSCCCLPQPPHTPPPLCTNAHAHTNKPGFAYLKRDSRTFVQLLEEPCRTYRGADKACPFLVFFFFFLRCHTFPRCPLLLSGRILFLTLAPSPSLHLFLPASSSPPFTSCCGVTDSVTQEQADGETEEEFDSMKAACKIVELANVRTIKVLWERSFSAQAFA